MNWPKLRSRIVKAKIYFNRTQGYASMFSLIGVAYLVAKQAGVHLKIRWVVGAFIVGFFVLMVLLGWLEDRLGILEDEQKEYAKRNPALKKLL